MEPTSERAREALEDHRARTGFGPGRKQAVRDRLEASIASGAAHDFVAELDQAAAEEGKGNPATAAGKSVRIGGMLALALAAGLAGVWWSSGDAARERLAPPPPAAAYEGDAVPVSERAEAPTPARIGPPEQLPEPARSDPASGLAPSDPPLTRDRVSPRPRARADRGEATAGSSPAAESTLAAELALLRAARRALARGDRKRALDELDHHADQFPRGQLEPERAALRVEVLCELDPEGGERERASFLARYGGSGHAKRVRALTCKSPG